ncbi:uncharacterized protein LOC125853646 [Solanum stenotomum]|uniref:uncharacterized protein LOC125853646 n=1 Tax=Solanum stenotomum TaxID=172797 RepID=UPI0020D13E9A|nr:uncharacterized protein LOC125853646 [Solanum stenotomum]
MGKQTLIDCRAEHDLKKKKQSIQTPTNQPLSSLNSRPLYTTTTLPSSSPLHNSSFSLSLYICMALKHMSYGAVNMFRTETGYTDIEKRQLFLRSYQFSRKKSVGERIKKSFFRVKRVIWVKLRSARKIRKLVWLRLKYGIFGYRRRRFFRRIQNSSYYNTSSGITTGWSSSCFW